MSGKYNWDSWSSTQAWRVQWLVEFDCLPESFRCQVYMEAARRNLKAVTLTVTGRLEPSQLHEGTYVFFQFYPQYHPWKPNLEALSAVRQLRK